MRPPYIVPRRSVSSIRVGRRYFLYCVGYLILLVVAYYVAGFFNVDSADREAEPTSCPMRYQVLIHASGEPEAFDGGCADLRLLAGGANVLRDRSFYSTMLVKHVTESIVSPAFDPRVLRPMKDRKIDVLYRSRNCDAKREAFAGKLRSRIEVAGYTFVANGECQGVGYSHKVLPKSEWSKGEFGDLDEGENVKIMLAFERFTPGLDYLSEKLFTPLTKGAIPAYFGNGHRHLQLLGVNPARILDRFKYATDDAFIQAIIHLLGDMDRMEKMKNEPVFLNLNASRARLSFWNDPKLHGIQGNPELIQYTMTSPKFESIRHRREITWHLSGSIFAGSEKKDRDFFRLAFNSTARRVQDKEIAHVEVNTCC
jgi:hypothetical protein